jgi:excisionase family DNA binding protein
MAQHLLTNRFVRTVTKAGMYNDGNGLYLQVGEGGNAKSWILRYARSYFGKAGKAEMGLGPVHTFSLDEARELARVYRQQLIKDGIDPLAQRNAERLAKRLEESKSVLFRECAADWIDFMSKRKKKGWDPKTARTVKRRIENDLSPLMDRPVAVIDVNQCYEVLKPIGDRGAPVMAIHVHMYLHGILERAKARVSLPSNPASLDGRLGILMPELRQDPSDVEHFAALAYQKIGAFMAQLRTPREVGTTAYTLKEAAEATGIDRSELLRAIHDNKLRAHKQPGTETLNTSGSPWFVEPTDLQKLYPLKSTPDRGPFIPLEAHLLQFQILTAARPGEARMMRWDELAPNWEETRLWIIPWFRHKIGKKTKKPIYKPLSDPAIEILKGRKAEREADGIVSDYVFAQGKDARLSGRVRKPLSDATMWKYLARFFKPSEAHLHGFRTTFSSWATDQRGIDPRDIKRALGHIEGEGENQVERIYNRYAKRLQPLGQLMDAWGKYCGRTELPGDLIQFPQTRAIGDSHA